MKDNKKMLLTGVLSLALLLSACDSKEKQNASENNADKNVKVEQKSEDMDKNKTKPDENSEEKNSSKSDEPKKDHEHENQKKRENVSLADWNGEWNSVEAYKDDPDLVEGMKAKAKEAGKDFKIYMDEKLKNRAFDFDGMLIDENKITYYDGKVEKDKIKTEGEYKFDQAYPVEHDGAIMYWYVFKTDGKNLPTYLTIMDLHGEESMAHFHMRIGDEKDKLIDPKSEWFPTFVRSSTPSSAMVNFLNH